MIILFSIFYFCLPIICTPIILYLFLTRSKYNKLYLLFLSMNLGIIGYNFIPLKEYDLTRHFEKIENIKNMDLFTALTYKGTNPLFIENLVFYIIGNIGNYNLLPFIGVSLTYFFAFLVIYDYFVSRNIKKKYIIFAILFVGIWYPLLSAMSGVRFTSALSISAYSTYIIYFKNNKRGYIYLFLLSFWHMGISLIFVIVILSKKIKLKYLLILILLLPFIMEAIIILFNFIPLIYFQTVAMKIEAYKAYRNPMAIDNLYIDIKFLAFASLLTYIILMRKKLELNSGLLTFIVSIILLCLVLYDVPSLIERYSYIILIFSPILVIENYLKINKYIKVLLFQIFSIVILAGYILQKKMLVDSIFGVNFTEGVFFTFWSLLN